MRLLGNPLVRVLGLLGAGLSLLSLFEFLYDPTTWNVGDSSDRIFVTALLLAFISAGLGLVYLRGASLGVKKFLGWFFTLLGLLLIPLAMAYNHFRFGVWDTNALDPTNLLLVTLSMPSLMVGALLGAPIMEKETRERFRSIAERLGFSPAPVEGSLSYYYKSGGGPAYLGRFAERDIVLAFGKIDPSLLWLATLLKSGRNAPGKNVRNFLRKSPRAREVFKRFGLDGSFFYELVEGGERPEQGVVVEFEFGGKDGFERVRRYLDCEAQLCALLEGGAT